MKLEEGLEEQCVLCSDAFKDANKIRESKVIIHCIF